MEEVEVGAVEVKAVEVRAVEVEAVEVDAVEVNAVEVEAIEVKAVEVKAVEVEVVEVEAEEMEAGVGVGDTSRGSSLHDILHICQMLGVLVSPDFIGSGVLDTSVVSGWLSLVVCWRFPSPGVSVLSSGCSPLICGKDFGSTVVLCGIAVVLLIRPVGSSVAVTACSDKALVVSV